MGKAIIRLIICLPVLVLLACKGQKLPEQPELAALTLHLNYETDMTIWHHQLDDSGLKGQEVGGTYDNIQEHGLVRYIIRAFPADEPKSSMQEFTFTKAISGGYNHEVNVELPVGEYEIMIWSDLAEKSDDSSFYNTDDFSEIRLKGHHEGCNDYRDAFRGRITAEISAGDNSASVIMERPMAKYEFITTDLKKVDNLEDYKVVLYYSGFMPSAYSFDTDKPVDSSTGVSFECRPKVLNDDEASLGFDYVLVNGKDAGVSVIVAIFDSNGKQVSLSSPVDIPLRRNHHTTIKGSFLLQKSQESIKIDPGFDGSHNVIID